MCGGLTSENFLFRFNPDCVKYERDSDLGIWTSVLDIPASKQISYLHALHNALFFVVNLTFVDSSQASITSIQDDSPSEEG